MRIREGEIRKGEMRGERHTQREEREGREERGNERERVWRVTRHKRGRSKERGRPEGNGETQREEGKKLNGRGEGCGGLRRCKRGKIIIKRKPGRMEERRERRE